MANEHSQIVPSMQPTSTVEDFKFWCQKVLPLVYDDSLSYYEVLNKMVVYLNQVIDNINADTANVAELEDDFLLLQTYVNNFFDDIDQLVTYTERAEAAQTAAAASAISAASSASNSATSASNSAGSASSAATSALSALDAKDAAVAAKTAAETALANAQTAATNAAASATAASGSATNAAASATAAQNSFTLADAARSAAQSAALSAESDAESAADSAAEAVAAVDTVINELGNITKTIENVPIATTEDALSSLPKKLAIDITPVQSGSGDPSPENVRPITGWTGTNIIRTGKNIFNGLYGTSNKQPLPKNIAAISCSGKSTGEYQLVIRFYNAENIKTGNDITIIAQGATSGAVTIATYLPNDAASFILFSPDSGDTTKFSNVQVEINNVATDYEPYSGQTIPITFPVEAGTVYGGVLTNENGEWKLSVVMFAIDGTSFTNILNSGVTDTTFTAQINFNANNMPSGISATCISNRFSRNIASGNVGRMVQATSTLYVVLPKNELPTIDADGVKAWFINNQSLFVYELATPVEYTLAESQALTLLNGINNVWADTGNINTLEYFTNAENYVTSQIDLAKSLIAPVLNEMKADTALVANDFRIVGNTLYRITGNIASGGTLTPNTNCVATTVGAILKSLLSA